MTVFERLFATFGHRPHVTTDQNRQLDQSMERLNEKAKADVRFASAMHSNSFNRAKSAIEKSIENSSATSEVVKGLLDSLNPHWSKDDEP